MPGSQRIPSQQGPFDKYGYGQDSLGVNETMRKLTGFPIAVQEFESQNKAIAEGNRLLNRRVISNQKQLEQTEAWLKANGAAMKVAQQTNLMLKMGVQYRKQETKELVKQTGIVGELVNLYAKSLAARQSRKGLQPQMPLQTSKNLALGVGFPLLFGGGPGSVIGSALGSFAGDGFGGQILGGAVGQLIDQAVVGAAALGNALQGAASSMSDLREQGVYVTAELDEQLKLANAAGDAMAARDIRRNAAFGDTGDAGGLGAQLAAGSVNELTKARNGLVNQHKCSWGSLGHRLSRL